MTLRSSAGLKTRLHLGHFEAEMRGSADALREDEGLKVTNKAWPDVVSGLIHRGVVVEGEPRKPAGGGRCFKPLVLAKPSANDKG